MNTWQLSKVCNAFIPNAVPSELVTGPALRAVERMIRKTGGLWVGGRVVANTQGIHFSANALNQAFHEDLEDVYIPLSEVLSVKREFGWITGIVVVEHCQSEFRFRCMGAKGVAAELSTYIVAT